MKKNTSVKSKQLTKQLYVFFQTAFYVAISAYVWLYIDFLFKNSRADFFANKTINLNQFFQLLKLNNSVFIVFTAILFIVIFILIFSHTQIDTSFYKYLLVAFDVWLTSIVVYFYISFPMQLNPFASHIAAILTLSMIMLAINIWLLSVQQHFIRTKLLFYLVIFILAFYNWLIKGSLASAIFDNIFAAFALNFFSAIVVFTYLFFSKLDTNKFLAVLLYSVLMPFLIAIAVVVIYSVFFILFSFFHFAGIFHNFFFGYLSKIFTITLLKNYGLDSLNGLLSLILVMWGISRFIINIDDDIRYSELSNKQFFTIIIGFLWLILMFASLHSKSKKTEHKIFKNFVAISAKKSKIFVDSENVYLIVADSSNSMFYDFSKDFILNKKFRIPAFDKVFYLKKDRFFSFNKINNTELEFDVFSSKKGLIHHKIIYADTIEDIGMSFDNNSSLIYSKSDTSILFNDAYIFAFFDIYGNLKWSQSGVTLPFYNSDAYFVFGDSLLLYSKYADTSCFVFIPKKKFYEKFKHLGDVVGYPCFSSHDYKTFVDFSPDSSLFISKLTTKKYIILPKISYVYNFSDLFYLQNNSVDSFYINTKLNNKNILYNDKKFYVFEPTYYSYLEMKTFNIESKKEKIYVFEQRYPKIYQIIIRNKKLYLNTSKGIAEYSLESEK